MNPNRIKGWRLIHLIISEMLMTPSSALNQLFYDNFNWQRMYPASTIYYSVLLHRHSKKREDKNRNKKEIVSLSPQRDFTSSVKAVFVFV